MEMGTDIDEMRNSANAAMQEVKTATKSMRDSHTKTQKEGGRWARDIESSLRTLHAQ